ncbi:unnamed protein product [Thelazia callipaeda]|uniref:Protein FRA10AC1 homolog n=1 Tax=Thelazia callipaeda TaxID=103827 RepID=A0A0N5D1T8_THECL|nr:unnamed protein product [Thelazia callipaeda]
MSKQNPSIDYEDLESEFDHADETETAIDAAAERKRRLERGDELWKKPHLEKVASNRGKARNLFDDEHSRVEKHKRRLMTLDVYSRHKELINQYYLFYPGATSILQRDTSRDRTDYDVLKSNHRFLWNDEELAKAAEKSWEARLAKRYYDKLFKEYCIADLSHYKKNKYPLKIAMRWRIEKEVKSGKGQFECGNKKCMEKENLTSWENNLKKNALVKLRLCPNCSSMLNYHSQKKKLEKKSKYRPKRLCQKKRQEETKSPEEKTLLQMEGPVPTEEHCEENKKEDPEVLSKNLIEIWKKPAEEHNSEKADEQELDAFLDDMLL